MYHTNIFAPHGTPQPLAPLPFSPAARVSKQREQCRWSSAGAGQSDPRQNHRHTIVAIAAVIVLMSFQSWKDPERSIVVSDKKSPMSTMSPSIPFPLVSGMRGHGGSVGGEGAGPWLAGGEKVRRGERRRKNSYVAAPIILF